MPIRTCPVPSARRPRWPERVRGAGESLIGRYLSRQAALPRGAFGHLLARIWVSESAVVNDAAVELLAPRSGEQICEVGFGPGRTLQLLADSGAEVVGVEVSPVMLATAARRNAATIAAGQMSLTLGDGIHLPVPDGSLDGALAVHTIYFWPDPQATLVDIARALRTGGRLVLAFQPGEHPLPARFDRAIYRTPTIGGATDWLHAAGFSDVGVDRKSEVSDTVVWLTATAI